MRIISGYLKGRKITQPNDKFTRPLKDLTKESIFNILQHSNLINFSLEKSEILDLFSGVGSFGLECLSRGAKSVVFCENYSESLKILRKNIINLSCQSKTEVVKENIFNIKNLNKFYKKKFEVIFLDPPFKEKRLANLLDDILSLKLLKSNGIIIIHRHKKEIEIYPKKFKILKTKTYGISKIIFGN
tara:strand:- start:1098 stop:1658 length:561 start_codon:yes stop_codon:yes gene_type:complete